MAPAILIVLNIPVYLALGWLIFDTKDDAATTIWETVVTILRMIFIPRILRVLWGEDDDGAWGIVPLLAFLFACGAVTYGEIWMIEKLTPLRILGG